MVLVDRQNLPEELDFGGYAVEAEHAVEVVRGIDKVVLLGGVNPFVDLHRVEPGAEHVADAEAEVVVEVGQPKPVSRSRIVTTRPISSDVLVMFVELTPTSTSFTM